MRLNIPPTFKAEDLENALEEEASANITKAEYESNYIIAHCVRNNKNTLAYSSDSTW